MVMHINTLSHNAYTLNRGISPMKLPQFCLFQSFLNMVPLVWTIFLSIIVFFPPCYSFNLPIKNTGQVTERVSESCPFASTSLQMIISFIFHMKYSLLSSFQLKEAL